MSIGNRIKQRREELKLTQPQLAKLLGVSKGTIGNYESNISSPNEQTLFRLFEILKCDANYLYQDNLKDSDFNITPDEEKMINQYRTLDGFGKEAVDSVLNIEYKRCQTESKTYVLPTAAKSIDNEPPKTEEYTADKVNLYRNADNDYPNE